MSCVTLIMLAAYTAFTFGQLETFTESVDQAQMALRLKRRTIAIGDRQAKASEIAVEAAKSAAETASNALTQSKIDSVKQEEINRATRKEFADESKAALDASIEAAHRDQ